MRPLGRIGVGVFGATARLGSGNDLGGEFVPCRLQPPGHPSRQWCWGGGLCQGHLLGFGGSHDGLLRVGGEDGPWEGDNDGWRVYNHPGVPAGHDAGLIAAGGQGLGTLCLAGVGARQLVRSHGPAVGEEGLQFMYGIRKKTHQNPPKTCTWLLILFSLALRDL